MLEEKNTDRQLSQSDKKTGAEPNAAGLGTSEQRSQ